ncbi:MAG: hypothetical protein ACYDCK_05340 [Thermoplasmatota archaeon]
MLPLVLAVGLVDLGVSDLPNWFFILFHVVALALAIYFATRAFDAKRRAGPDARAAHRWSKLGLAFALFAVAEVSYLLYHFYVTSFLLAHLIAEALDLAAFVVLFMAATREPAPYPPPL